MAEARRCSPRCQRLRWRRASRPASTRPRRSCRRMGRDRGVASAHVSRRRTRAARSWSKYPPASRLLVLCVRRGRGFRSDSPEPGAGDRRWAVVWRQDRIATRRLSPRLVRGLVVAEASPEPDPEAPTTVAEWLRSWPVPFPDRRVALEFFGGDSLWARAWADGLERRQDGLWPSFDVGVMTAALRDCDRADGWNEWRRIHCPTLVVRAERGLPPATAERMAGVLPSATVAEVGGAGHDLHLENAEGWRAAIEPFLLKLVRPG